MKRIKELVQIAERRAIALEQVYADIQHEIQAGEITGDIPPNDCDKLFSSDVAELMVQIRDAQNALNQLPDDIESEIRWREKEKVYRGIQKWF